MTKYLDLIMLGVVAFGGYALYKKISDTDIIPDITMPDITLPDFPDITIPDFPDITIPDFPEFPEFPSFNKVFGDPKGKEEYDKEQLLKENGECNPDPLCHITGGGVACCPPEEKATVSTTVSSPTGIALEHINMFDYNPPLVEDPSYGTIEGDYASRGFTSSGALLGGGF